MKDTKKSAKSTAASDKTYDGFTDEERGAMKERAQELKAAARRGSRASKADGESDVLAKIAEMPEPDRTMGERIHAVIKANAPALSPRLWYGMPAYAKDGQVVCFFQSAHKFNSRYATFGFNDKANLDDGAHVADLLRCDEVDRRRGGKDRRAREESGELRPEQATAVAVRPGHRRPRGARGSPPGRPFRGTPARVPCALQHL